MVTPSDANPGVVPEDGGIVAAAGCRVRVELGPARVGDANDGAFERDVRGLGVRLRRIAARDDLVAHQHDTAVYSDVSPTSSLPSPRTGCVGSAVKMHDIPAVTNWGASTSLTKIVLLS